jgi:hypothetical protein
MARPRRRQSTGRTVLHGAQSQTMSDEAGLRIRPTESTNRLQVHEPALRAAADEAGRVHGHELLGRGMSCSLSDDQASFQDDRRGAGREVIFCITLPYCSRNK